LDQEKASVHKTVNVVEKDLENIDKLQVYFPEA
jgi:hypothetical protein